jgi:hypothetical protein
VRLLLVGYLYRMISERVLLEEVRMHLAFVGSHGWGLSKRFLTIPLSPRTAMDVSASRVCFEKCSRRS